jgi:hypothetical protein
VRAEKGGLAGEFVCDLKDAALGGDVQAVAALDLNGGGARAVHLGEQAACVRAQLALTRGARGRNRRHDAAAGVRLPRHPRLELRGALAREDHVRVAVDEARHNRTTAELDALVGRRRIACATHPRDATVLGDEGGVVQQPQRALVAKRRLARREFADAGEERRAHRSPSRIGMRTPRSSATSTARS